jgi:carbon-monoxide dehydrogenase small subunit
MITKLTINGEIYDYSGDPRSSLVNVLRETFHMTGSKAVCMEGFCGACNVLIDGEPVVSCLKAIGTLSGNEITTIEGMAKNGLNPVQKAFEEYDVVQCGMCFPGIIITITYLLSHNPNPTREEVKSAMIGNICRCTGYERIVDAVMSIGKD